MYSLRTGKGAPLLISHMRDVHHGDPEALRFAGLQRVYTACDGSDRPKRLVQCESRWIINVKALGLNDHNDLSPFL